MKIPMQRMSEKKKNVRGERERISPLLLNPVFTTDAIPHKTDIENGYEEYKKEEEPTVSLEIRKELF